MKEKTSMQLGMIGLGRMGANMVRRLIKDGHQCVVFDRSADAVKDLVKETAVGATSPADFVKKLKKPRAVWLMVPAAAVDKAIADLSPLLEAGDILIDGGNSYYVDDIRRAKELASKGIHYVDVGSAVKRTWLNVWIRFSPPWRPAWAIFPAPPVVRSLAVRPNKATCIAVRTERAISSKWSTTGSNTASWPPMLRAWAF